MVYSVLQEILNYPYIHKPKRYNKPKIEIFVEIHFLCKRLKTAIIMRYNLFNTIVIFIILNILYSDFKITIARILETENKTIKEI